MNRTFTRTAYQSPTGYGSSATQWAQSGWDGRWYTRYLRWVNNSKQEWDRWSLTDSGPPEGMKITAVHGRYYLPRTYR